jgi:branched-chain amino acid transport system substrate-binding protein
MKHSIKKLVAGTALALGALSAIAADPIKIGSVLSVTGPAAFLGDPELKTLQLYVEDLNKKGGVLGRQLQLSITTTAATPTRPTASPSA